MIIKYQVKGENNMPFNLSKITIISTAASKTEDENNIESIKQNPQWNLQVNQINDLYFFVDKKDILNSEYVKKIKKYRNNLTIEILEKITAELGEPKQKSERYVDAFVKKYVGKFHSEQEMADVLEKLLIGYLKDNKLLDKKGGG